MKIMIPTNSDLSYLHKNKLFQSRVQCTARHSQPIPLSLYLKRELHIAFQHTLATLLTSNLVVIYPKLLSTYNINNAMRLHVRLAGYCLANHILYTKQQS